MWNLSLPSKVKITLWRIASNFLPTLYNLQRRRLNVRNVCPFCQSYEETTGIGGDILGCLVFPNKLVHEGYKSSIYEVSSFITAFICEQDSICRPNGSAHPIVVPRWKAPQEAVVKINFDSAFSCHSRSATSGIVARDNEGFILAACAFPHSNVSDAFVAEALACLQAVHFAKDMGFLNVTIEGDSLSVCKKLNSSSQDRSLIAPIISDIKELAVGFWNISFACVRREANRTAHSLAREYRAASTPYYWIEEVPPGTAAAAELDKRHLLSVRV
ncbi:hypothetical protein GQ457_02G006440 [Hibiscus cannabinus]